jgi:hypothetical protein
MNTPLASVSGRTAENRHMDDVARIPPAGERRARHTLQQPLPAPPRASHPLPDTSDWTFDIIEQYHDVIRDTAQRFGLDTYPNQLEIITAEQMMDAYASVGMPINYRHWSYGKEFIATDKRYRRGNMGLAYEIVINSNPCISYLMEENTTAMQALVIAHAAYGHNSFFKGNYLFRMWTDASSIIDYLVFARSYIAECEERYGLDAVESVLDSCHALANFGVDRYRRPSKKSLAVELAERRAREAHAQLQVNDLWRTLPQRLDKPEDAPAAQRFPSEPQENLLYFIEKKLPAAGTLATRSVASGAQDRPIFLSAAADAGHERRLGHLLAPQVAQHHVRRWSAERRRDDGVAEFAYQCDLPAACGTSRVQRNQPLRTGLCHVHRHPAYLRATHRGRPTLVPRHGRSAVAAHAGPCHAQLQGRELHRSVSQPQADARLPSLCHPRR